VRLRDHALPLTRQEPPLDLNYLFHRRGVSLMMADRAACSASRDAHLGLAGGYAERIRALRPSRALAA
jgi:hypothetical protein